MASPATLAEDSVVRMLATNANLLAISEAEQNCTLGAVVFLLLIRCRESFDPGGRPGFPMMMDVVAPCTHVAAPINKLIDAHGNTGLIKQRTSNSLHSRSYGE